MIQQNIHIIMTEGIRPQDITCNYSKGIVSDTVTLRNASGKGLHNVQLTLTLDDSAQKTDTMRLWRGNASQTYRFRLRRTTRIVRVDLLCDEGRLEYEYQV